MEPIFIYSTHVISKSLITVKYVPTVSREQIGIDLFFLTVLYTNIDKNILRSLFYSFFFELYIYMYKYVIDKVDETYILL